ncbi:hypothetical protein R3P38DRAFT_2785248 [Favolaschia claudopus]|uniref:Elongator complex protein 5 n=1 Tax=Favolaschia claudopus TaxID=2862362 RepID=A0AAW0AX81_9AGAR
MTGLRTWTAGPRDTIRGHSCGFDLMILWFHHILSSSTRSNAIESSKRLYSSSLTALHLPQSLTRVLLDDLPASLTPPWSPSSPVSLSSTGLILIVDPALQIYHLTFTLLTSFLSPSSLSPPSLLFSTPSVLQPMSKLNELRLWTPQLHDYEDDAAVFNSEPFVSVFQNCLNTPTTRSKSTDDILLEHLQTVFKPAEYGSFIRFQHQGGNNQRKSEGEELAYRALVEAQTGAIRKYFPSFNERQVPPDFSWTDDLESRNHPDDVDSDGDDLKI